MFGGEFDRQWDKAQRRHERFSKFVIGFIVVVFVLVILSWIVMGVTAVKVVGEVESQGLKPLIERIWCGPQEPKCLSK